MSTTVRLTSKIRNPNKKLIEGVCSDIANSLGVRMTKHGTTIRIGSTRISIRANGYVELSDRSNRRVAHLTELLEDRYAKAALIIAFKNVGFSNLRMQQVTKTKDMVAGVRW